MYQSEWTPALGEELGCQREEDNASDPYAVAVMRRNVIVGHVPMSISAISSLFLRRNGSIQCTITGERRHSADLPQGGLEVPCMLKFTGEPKDIMKVRKLFLLHQKPEVNEKPGPSKHLNLDAAIDVCGEFRSSKKIKLEETRTETEQSIDLEEVVAPVNFAKPWLTYDQQVLTLVDKALIVSGDELTDEHINFAQAVLKQQHGISGLWSSLLLSTMRSPVTTPALQIMHCRGNHWLVVTAIGYSLYSSLDKATHDLIIKLFAADACINAKMEECPKQSGVKNCGAFAIANATLLAVGGNPSTHAFNQHCMRVHLLKRFEAFCLTPFPTT